MILFFHLVNIVHVTSIPAPSHLLLSPVNKHTQKMSSHRSTHSGLPKIKLVLWYYQNKKGSPIYPEPQVILTCMSLSVWGMSLLQRMLWNLCSRGRRGALVPWADRSLSVSCAPLSHSWSNSRMADNIWLKRKGIYSPVKTNQCLPYHIKAKQVNNENYRTMYENAIIMS